MYQGKKTTTKRVGVEMGNDSDTLPLSLSSQYPMRSGEPGCSNIN